ncbi:MAG: alpha/beta hydrolase, partial [Pedobacter sp.]
MNKSLVVLFVILCGNFRVYSQQVINLYIDAIPGAVHDSSYVENINKSAVFGNVVSKVSVPTITSYFSGRPNGTAIIICPGGAYGVLMIDMEGSKIARALNELGITAFVLKYRLPTDRIMLDKS